MTTIFPGQGTVYQDAGIVGLNPFLSFTAAATVSSPGAVHGTYVLEVDWNNDGDFSDANEDCTADLLSVQTTLGRDFASQIAGDVSTGTLVAYMLNLTGKYSTFNTSSPIYGSILPNRPVRLRTTAPGPYTLWQGFISRIEPDVQVGPYNTVRLYAVGGIELLANATVTPEASTGDLTGTLIGLVLDEAGWSATKRNIDAGNTTTGRWYLDDENALEAVRQLKDTEAGFFYEDAEANLVFENRYYRSLQARSTASQATFSDASGASLPYSAIVQVDPIGQIFNRARAEVKNFTVEALAVLWTYEGSNPVIVGGPGSSQTFTATFNSLYVDAWTTPVQGTDITWLSNGYSGAANTISVVKRATEMDITIIIASGIASTRWEFDLIQARGTAVVAADSTFVSADNATSQTSYGVRSFPFPSTWAANINEAQALCDYIVDAYGDARPTLTLELVANRSSAMLSQCLTRRLSDRVTIVADNNAVLGINEDFFLESISHVIDTGGLRHHTTMQFSPASVGLSGPFWILGTSELGVTTRLGF